MAFGPDMRAFPVAAKADPEGGRMKAAEFFLWHFFRGWLKTMTGVALIPHGSSMGERELFFSILSKASLA
jgi:hypothetical protein